MALTYITVIGTYKDIEGNPLHGYLEFTPSSVLSVSSIGIIPPQAKTVVLDENGQFTTTLLATDHLPTEVQPEGWLWQVDEKIPGGMSWYFGVERNGPNPLDLTYVRTLPPIDPPSYAIPGAVALNGVGLPPGGLAFSILYKTSDDDYSSAWGEQSVIVHGNLSGLDTGDDHTQYFNEVRGDDRYAQKGHLHSGEYVTSVELNNHEAAADPHPGYLKLAEVLAGANITITDNLDGTITIASTGGGGGTSGNEVVISDTVPLEYEMWVNPNEEPTPVPHDHDEYLLVSEVLAGTNVTVTDNLDGTVTISSTGGDLSAHIAASDPHTQYQKESEKNAASGYAGLDGSSKIAFSQLPTGTGASQVSVGTHNHDGTYSAVGHNHDGSYSAVGHGHAHDTLSGLADDDHTQYALVVVSATAPGSPRVGTLWVVG